MKVRPKVAVMTHSKWLGTSRFAKSDVTPGGGGRAGTFLSCSHRAGLMFTMAGFLCGAFLLTLGLPKEHTWEECMSLIITCQSSSVNPRKVGR